MSADDDGLEGGVSGGGSVMLKDEEYGERGVVGMGGCVPFFAMLCLDPTSIRV